jgi:Spy/CpxP family protein refolding chaperone
VNRWRVILVTLVIFGAGALTGALVVRSVTPADSKPSEPAGSANYWRGKQHEFLAHMEKHLDLTPAQTNRIDQAFRESNERLKPMREQMGEEFHRVQAQILEVLDDTQRTKFEKMIRHKGPRKSGDRDADRKRDEASPEEGKSRDAAVGDPTHDGRRCCKSPPHLEFPWSAWRI